MLHNFSIAKHVTIRSILVLLSMGVSRGGRHNIDAYSKKKHLLYLYIALNK